MAAENDDLVRFVLATHLADRVGRRGVGEIAARLAEGHLHGLPAARKRGINSASSGVIAAANAWHAVFVRHGSRVRGQKIRRRGERISRMPTAPTFATADAPL